jgi:hypothetical protein
LPLHYYLDILLLFERLGFRPAKVFIIKFLVIYRCIILYPISARIKEF